MLSFIWRLRATLILMDLMGMDFDDAWLCADTLKRTHLKSRMGPREAVEREVKQWRGS